VTTAVIYGSKIVNAAFGFATAIVIARVLGPEGRAEYFLTAALATGVFSVFNLGLETSTFWALSERRVSTARLKRALVPATLIVTALALGAYAFVALGTGVLTNVPSQTALVGLTLIPALIVRWILDGFLYAVDRARIASVSLVATAALQLASVVVTAASGRLTSAAVLAIASGSTIVGGIPSAVAVVRFREEAETEETVGTLALFRVGLTVHAGSIALWVAQRIDVFIVAALVAKSQLGVYSLSITLSEFALLATDAVALAALGRQRVLGRRESFAYSVTVASWSARIAAVQVVGIILLGWPLIRIAFGPSWVDAYPVLVAMSPGMIALAYVRPLGAAFVRAGRLAEISLLMSSAGVINVVGTIAAVPVLGILGAGIVSTVAYSTTAFLFAWRVRRTLGIPWWRSRGQAESTAHESPLGSGDLDPETKSPPEAVSGGWDP
jgi:O-antigen/teichoic acid export membrane protein